MSKRVLKGVYVEWVDANTTNEWMTYDEAIKEKVETVTSIGFLLSGGKKGQDAKLVSSAGADGGVMGVLTIPAQWVLKITTLPDSFRAIMKEPENA